jgi:hypothetical protein
LVNPYTSTTAFAPDQFHPAPFLQGLLANLVDTAYNQGFHQTLPILSDQQIVTNSGFTPNTATTFFNVQPFVLLPVPEPATYVLAVVACLGLAFRRHMFARPKVAGEKPA